MIDTKVDVDLTVVRGKVECHIEVQLSMDIIKEKGHCMIKIIEVISEEEISEECKITEVKILEV